MAAGNNTTEELLRRLDAQHQAYLETFRLVHEALGGTATPGPAPAVGGTGNGNGNGSSRPSLSFSINNNGPTGPPSTSTGGSHNKLPRRSLTLEATDPDRPPPLTPARTFTIQSSLLTGDSDSSDEDEDLYVQTPLPTQKFDLEHLREHLKTYRFNEQTRLILEGVFVAGSGSARLKNPALFGDGAEGEDGGVGSHYSVFDVGTDGAPLSRAEVVKDARGIDDAIWQVIRDVNADSTKERKAVGRITVVREPSPLIFGALHLTMNQNFDMDEIYKNLVQDNDTNPSRALMSQDRAFSPDERHQRSFIFSFEYFTIVSPDCKPMPWQLGDRVYTSKSHIPISRCCAIVALSLSGPPIRRLKNISRRTKKVQYGHVYDPWAPWHVLSTQCYPDLKHSMDTHDSSRHYTNGPEAFLNTLLAEFRDAQKRFEEVLLRISKLVTPPADFMFNSKLRDALLFEDADFTYSRRYFWAYQTLGIMNQNIKSLIDAYTDTFTDVFWSGDHKHLWPVLEKESPRSVYYLKRLQMLRREFDREVENFKEIAQENNERRKEIRTLRDQLFSGTSVLESRKSVEMASITIQQGHNIKLLTLVSIFFLPLTFVTSVFGMTNMSTKHTFNTFGIVMATVCIPFFFLIGSLNTTQGMEFWIGKWHALLAHFTKKRTAKKSEEEQEEEEAQEKRPQKRMRSMSHLEALAKRRGVKGFVGRKQTRRVDSVAVSGARNEEKDSERRSWFDRVLGRRRRGNQGGAGVSRDRDGSASVSARSTVTVVDV